MQYLERPPSARLSRWVHCVWMFEALEPGAAADRIVPDGRPELVIHFGEPFREIDAGGLAVEQARIVFAGQVTRPLHLLSPGNAGVVGVRFKPDGARAFLGMPMRDATDKRVSAAAFAPHAATLADAIAAAASLDARIGLAEAFVLHRINEQGAPPDDAVRLCVERIEASRGCAGIDELTALARLGRRQLERRFADRVGIGPALLASIFRFRSVFDVMERGGARPWTDAAVEAGYYDQSHFIREFHRFVGCTPSEFMRAGEGLATALVA